MNDGVLPKANSDPGGAPRAIFAMAKPVSAACNLNCRYCYYLHRPDMGSSRRMGRDVLEAFTRDSIAAQAHLPEIHFAWQGGEPTLAGLEFFREAIALQQRYQPAGARIANALQTNGTLLTEAWAEFFAEHRFLIGLSLDGPAQFHDPLRRDTDGRASHAKALRGLELLQRHGVELNTLTVVHRLNYRHGRAVYRFLRRIGAPYMQFIPLVERIARGARLAAPPPDDPRAELAPWTPPPDGFGRFLCEVFDEWIAHDVGRVFVQLIEEHVTALAGMPARLCVFAADCSGNPILEANGDLYSCDHYAFPAYRLGNILKGPIAALADSEQQRTFGRKKMNDLPEECLRCEFLSACCGGCPKHRFAGTRPGGKARSYLCPSYRMFFAHTAPALRGFAAAARAGF